MYRLLVLGTPQVRDAAGLLLGRLMQPRPMAFLSVLAVGGAGGVTRDRMVALLWGEVPESRARHNLSETLYAVHRDLGAEAVSGVGQVLYLSADLVATDLAEFLGALRTGDRAAAVALYRAPFLDGFHVTEAPAFDEWHGAERQRLASLHAEALETLARAAAERGDQPSAARWWRRLLALDPLNSPAAIGLSRALAAAGDRANAMEVLLAHRALIGSELPMEAGRGVLEAIDQLRGPVPAPPHGTEGTPGPPATPQPTAATLPTDLHPPGTPRADTTPTAVRATTTRERLRRWGLWAAAAVGLAVVGLAAARLLELVPRSITLEDVRPVSSEPGFEFQPTVSPDGREVAYLAGSIGLPRLVIRSVGGTGGSGEVRLPDSVRGSQWYPSWSADGEFVRFLSASVRGPERWDEVGRLGGAVRAVTLPSRASWPAWSPDGSHIAFVVADTIFTGATADAVWRVVAVHRDSVVDLHSLAWSPDGKRIAYVSGNAQWTWNANVAGSAVWVVDATGGRPFRLTTNEYLNASPAWLDAGHLLFVSNRNGVRSVYVVAVGRRAQRGQPRLVPGVADPYSITYSTTARVLVWAKLTVPQNVRAYSLGGALPVPIRSGRPVTSGTQVVEELDVSPDGKWLVFDSNLRGNLDVYRVSVRGGQAVRLTDYGGNERHPRWSPDGTEVAFLAEASRTDVGWTRVMTIPSGGGTPIALATAGCAAEGPAWSPDWRRIAFACVREGRRYIWVVSRDSAGGAWHEAVLVLADSVQEMPYPNSSLAEWEPHGRGLLLQTGASLELVSLQGRVLWRRDLASTTRLGQIYGGWRYSLDGRTIYFEANHSDGRRGIWAIDVAGGDPRLVLLNDSRGLINGNFSVGRDWLYVSVAEPESDIWVARLHW